MVTLLSAPRTVDRRLDNPGGQVQEESLAAMAAPPRMFGLVDDAPTGRFHHAVAISGGGSVFPVRALGSVVGRVVGHALPVPGVGHHRGGCGHSARRVPRA
jgi:hypothetical protein